MPGSQALVVIEDENDEAWTWKRLSPSKDECIRVLMFKNKNKSQFNLFYQSEFNLDKAASFVADTAQPNLDCKIVNEEVDIKDSKD